MDLEAVSTNQRLGKVKRKKLTLILVMLHHCVFTGPNTGSIKGPACVEQRV